MPNPTPEISGDPENCPLYQAMIDDGVILEPEGNVQKVHSAVDALAMKLTWNQERALSNLARYPDGTTPKQLAEPFAYFQPYLCGASARSAVYALVRKGLAECSYAGSPMRYRITESGRRALSDRSRET